MTRAYTLQDVINQLNNQGSTQVDYSVTAQINNVYIGIDNAAVSETSSSVSAEVFYPLVVVQDACPVVYMRFNDPSGNPWDSNATGLKNTSTPTSITYGNTGPMGAGVGGAIGLSKSTTSGVSVPDSTTNFDFFGDLSVEMWVKTWTFPTGTTKYPIVSKGWSTIGEFAVAIDDSGLLWFNDNATNTFELAYGSQMASNTWYHCVFTRSALTGYATYVNGVLQTTGVYPASVVPSHTTHAINFGAADSTSTNAVYLSEVALYERVLTAAQILKHYQMGTGALGTLVESGYGEAFFAYGLMQCPNPALPSISKYGTGVYGTSLWD
jgi:Concanavalin A-like lectin/glucanases superfamily